MTTSSIFSSTVQAVAAASKLSGADHVMTYQELWGSAAQTGVTKAELANKVIIWTSVQGNLAVSSFDANGSWKPTVINGKVISDTMIVGGAHLGDEAQAEFFAPATPDPIEANVELFADLVAQAEAANFTGGFEFSNFSYNGQGLITEARFLNEAKDVISIVADGSVLVSTSMDEVEFDTIALADAYVDALFAPAPVVAPVKHTMATIEAAADALQGYQAGTFATTLNPYALAGFTAADLDGNGVISANGANGNESIYGYAAGTTMGQAAEAYVHDAIQSGSLEVILNTPAHTQHAATFAAVQQLTGLTTAELQVAAQGGSVEKGGQAFNVASVTELLHGLNAEQSLAFAQTSNFFTPVNQQDLTAYYSMNLIAAPTQAAYADYKVESLGASTVQYLLNNNSAFGSGTPEQFATAVDNAIGHLDMAEVQLIGQGHTVISDIAYIG